MSTSLRAESRLVQSSSFVEIKPHVHMLCVHGLRRWQEISCSVFSFLQRNQKNCQLEYIEMKFHFNRLRPVTLIHGTDITFKIGSFKCSTRLLLCDILTIMKALVSLRLICLTEWQIDRYRKASNLLTKNFNSVHAVDLCLDGLQQVAALVKKISATFFWSYSNLVPRRIHLHTEFEVKQKMLLLQQILHSASEHGIHIEHSRENLLRKSEIHNIW